MKCPKCIIENPEENKFCRECGTALNLEEQTSNPFSVNPIKTIRAPHY